MRGWVGSDCQSIRDRGGGLHGRSERDAASDHVFESNERVAGPGTPAARVASRVSLTLVRAPALHTYGGCTVHSGTRGRDPVRAKAHPQVGGCSHQSYCCGRGKSPLVLTMYHAPSQTIDLPSHF